MENNSSNHSNNSLEYKHKYIEHKMKYIKLKWKFQKMIGGATSAGGTNNDLYAGKLKELDDKINKLQVNLINMRRKNKVITNKISKDVVDSAELILNRYEPIILSAFDKLQRDTIKTNNMITRLNSLIIKLESAGDAKSANKIKNFETDLKALRDKVNSGGLTDDEIDSRVKGIMKNLSNDFTNIEDKVISNITDTIQKGMLVRHYYSNKGPALHFSWLN
jgi:hypothetical protein